MLTSKYPIGTIGVMAGLPSNLWEFTWSLAECVSYTGQYLCGPEQYVHLVNTPHSFHSDARNALVKQTLGNWLLQLDTDHAFDPDLVCRLHNASIVYQAPVIAGMYLMKKPPYGPVLWHVDDNGDKHQLADWDEKEMLEIGAAGAGCLFVQRWVYDRIREELGEEPFSTSEFPGLVGEDFAFFRRLKKLGIRACVAPWIECYHLEVRRLKANEHYERASVRSKAVAVQRALPVGAA